MEGKLRELERVERELRESCERAEREIDERKAENYFEIWSRRMKIKSSRQTFVDRHTLAILEVLTKPQIE